MLVVRLGLAPLVDPRSWPMLEQGGIRFGNSFWVFFLPDVGAYFLPCAMCEAVGTCVVEYMPCVCSIFGTGCKLCIWFGPCAKGQDSCNLGPYGLSYLSRQGLVRRGPYGDCWACLVWPMFSTTLALPYSSALLSPSPSSMLLRMENLHESSGRFLVCSLLPLVVLGFWIPPFSLAFFISVGITPLFTRRLGHYVLPSTP